MVYVLVDALDLAAVKALRYAHELRPDEVRAVHFMIDEVHARRLMNRWERASATTVPLEILACPDRRLHHAVLGLALRTTEDGRTALTLLVPRRTYSPLLGRLLHRGTGDQLAKSVEHLRDVAVTILPFDVERAVERLRAGAPDQGGPGAHGPG